MSRRDRLLPDGFGAQPSRYGPGRLAGDATMGEERMEGSPAGEELQRRSSQPS